MGTGPRRTELLRRERTLQNAYEIVTEADRPFSSKVDDLFELVCETLDTDFATLSRVHEDAGEYIFERVTSPSGIDLEHGDRAALETLSNCARVVSNRETLVLADVESQAPALADPEWGIACYLGVPVVVDDEVYGTFCFYDVESRSEQFSDWEVTFVELLSNWVSHELDRQRDADRIGALNELNASVRQVATAVIDQSCRNEIEAVACESLANADSFRFAWIGELDPDTGAVQVRTEAGVDGVLDDVTLPVTDDEGLAPPASALRSGSIQTRQEVGLDATSDAWVEHADAFQYEASASVPIMRAGTATAVLTVHSDRPHAFDEEEGAVMEYLGDLLGHAIAAVERKQALTSDTLVELTLSIQDALAVWGITDPPAETVHLHELVPIDEEAVIAFGTANADGMPAVRTLGREIPVCEEVTRTATAGDEVAFDIRFSELPLVTRLTALGARVDQMLFESGDVRMTVYLPPDTDVRHVVDVVEDLYPGADLVSKRETSPQNHPANRVGRTLASELTDRQLDVLRTAYFAGYFEYPRTTSGEAVADRLDISNATFSQHLRAAQQKFFAAIFDSESSNGI